MSQEKGLFELNGNYYTLKFNMHKVEQIEQALGISFMGEIIGSNGVLSFRLLRHIFAVGLYTKDEKPIMGQKAQEIYEQLLRDIGYANLSAIAVGKIQEDLAFLFPEN